MKSSTKIAVIGLGQMGMYYIQTLLALGIQSQNIIGIDIDLKKCAVAKNKFPNLLVGETTDIISGQIDAAIVATITPSHDQVCVDLMKKKAKRILCEKPLGINLAAVDRIGRAMKSTGSQVFTALLMNFSPAILRLIQKMQKEELILIEGGATWTKNRYGDLRPSFGVLEDEMVHGAGILHTLCSVNQKINKINIMGQLTHSQYTNSITQTSYSVRPDASAMVIEKIQTDYYNVSCILHSSFIGPRSIRQVIVVLSKKENPNNPIYSIEFNFDKKTKKGIVDELIIITLEGNIVKCFEYPCNKLEKQVQAFLKTISGITIDSHLASFTEARQLVAFTEAVKQSDKLGGRRVSL